MRLSVIAVLILVACAIASAPAHAVTWVLKADGTGDAPTIQIAVTGAAPGDTVLLEAGTYTGPGNRNVVYNGKAVTVRGGDEDRAGAIIDCEGQGRAFDFSGGETLASRLENLTIINGFVATSGGGAIRVNLHSRPTITDVHMENNRAPVGGALACWLSSPRIARCTVIGNSTPPGGGGGGFAIHQSSDPLISRCWFEGNTASYSGAMEVYNSSATILYCTFAFNSCTGMGGAIGCQYATPFIGQCTIVGNASSDSSSGIFLYQSAPEIQCSVIAFNQTCGVWCFGDCSTPVLTRTDIFANLWGDWIGCVAGMELTNQNLWVNPQLCDWANGNFYLEDTSPLLDCGYPCACFIGAWDVGCAGVTSVHQSTVQETESWSTLKKLYR